MGSRSTIQVLYGKSLPRTRQTSTRTWRRTCTRGPQSPRPLPSPPCPGPPPLPPLARRAAGHAPQLPRSGRGAQPAPAMPHHAHHDMTRGKGKGCVGKGAAPRNTGPASEPHPHPDQGASSYGLGPQWPGLSVYCGGRTQAQTRKTHTRYQYKYYYNYYPTYTHTDRTIPIICMPTVYINRRC